MSPSKIVVASLLFLTVCSAQAETTPVGILLPLSGGAAGYGKACLNGIELAQDDYATELKEKVTFLIEDDKNAPPSTVSALKSLQQKARPKIFLSWASNTSKAINTLAEKEDFILFAIATDPEVALGKRNVFRYWVSAETETRKLLEAVKRRGITRIAVVTAQHEGLLSIKNALLEIASSEGIEIVYDEELVPEQMDFRTVITKLKKVPNLHGIFNNLYVGQSGTFARQARDLGVKLPLFAVELYEDHSVLEAARGALEGEIYVSASDGSGEFVTRYFSRFPKATILSAANCYDFIAFLAKAPDLSVSGFRQFLFELHNFPGMVGEVSSTRDQSFSLPAVVKQVRGSKFVVLEE